MMGGVLMILGGPPRCGKTLLAQQVASERGIGWLSTDTIRDVVSMFLPALYEVGGPGDPHDPEADLFFPYFEKVVESCSYLVDDYLIEGVGFLPRHIAELAVRFEFRPVFVGMLHVELDSLLEHEGRNQWHRHLDPDALAIGAGVDRVVEPADRCRVRAPRPPVRRAQRRLLRRHRTREAAFFWDPHPRVDRSFAAAGSSGGEDRRVGPSVVCLCHRRAPSRSRS